jgi:hypothetical protein
MLAADLIDMVAFLRRLAESRNAETEAFYIGGESRLVSAARFPLRPDGKDKPFQMTTGRPAERWRETRKSPQAPFG